MNAFGSFETGYSNLSLEDQVYLIQSNIIRKVAREGPCVIVGRCADYILKDMSNVVNIFIWADLESRKTRAIERYGLEEKKAEEEVLRIDKGRINYYKYHSGERWGRAENYHLSIKSDYLGIDHTVDVIAKFLTAARP